MTLKRTSILLQAFEVILFTLIISAVGYFLNPKDPLLIHYEFSFLILWLAIVTLFYGLKMGLIMWSVFAVVAYLTYFKESIFTSILLENLFFVFLFGLFFSNLHTEINKYKIKTKYLQLRLKELSNAFFTLKISHDKLESIYIIQPISVRFLISETLKNTHYHKPEQSAENTLKILKKFFSVQSAAIYKVHRGRLAHHFASIGDINIDLNTKDKLIEETLTLKKPIYLNDLNDKEQTSYIYAIPFLDKRNDIVAILIIKDIPFLSYHQDTLLKINVAFNYIWREYKKRAFFQKENNLSLLKSQSKGQQNILNFKLEVLRLNNILDEFNIDSRIYIISTRNVYIDREIKDFLYQNELLEILDQSISIKCHDKYIHMILFPFVSNPSIYQKAKTLNQKLEEIEEKQRVVSFENGLSTHLEENYKELQKKHISVKDFQYMIEEYNCV